MINKSKTKEEKLNEINRITCSKWNETRYICLYKKMNKLANKIMNILVFKQEKKN